MKNIVTLLLSLPFLLNAQNIPNAGFENWLIGQVVLEAQDWTSSNFYTFNQFGIYSVNPEYVYVAEGFTSARLSTEELDTLGPFAAFLVSGSPMPDHLTGELDIMTGGTPFPHRPTKMIGKYQYQSNSPIEDFGQAHVILKKWNAAMNKPDTIGYGQNTLLNPAADFQTFEVPIQYFDPVVIPDSVIVVLYSTYPNSPNSGSVLWVDDLSFDFTSSTDEFDALVDVKVYPNPFAELVQIEIQALEKGNIELVGAVGKTYFKIPVETGHQKIELKTVELAPGNYFIVWKTEHGENRVIEKLVKTK